MKILKFPDPFLFKVVDEVTLFDEQLTKEANEMVELMYQAKGIGLAANQVGLNKRIFVMQSDKANSATPYFFVNPKIINLSEKKEISEEGCLSFPKLYAGVARNKEVTVSWQDLNGEAKKKTFSGLEAVCVQHEIDHLNGVVFVSHLSPVKKGMALTKFQKLQSR